MSTPPEIPTVRLCPICSVPPHVYQRPGWHYARLTSKVRGSDHWFMQGCQHAADIHKAALVPAAKRDELMAAWNLYALGLFTQRTADWKPEEREKFSAALGFPP